MLSLKPIYLTIFRVLLTGLVVFFILASFTITSANAQSLCWTTVGAVGTVDEAAFDVVDISGDHIAINSDVNDATVNVRYNVVAVEGLLGGDRNTKTMTARLVDNGENAQVIVELRELNLSTGSFSTLAEIDSNNFDANFQAQAHTISFNCQGAEFDFENNVYYIAVKLIKTGVDGNPLIRGIRICGNGIC